MKYYSTRDNQITVTGAEAIARGIAPDGGLFAPRSFPQITIDELRGMARLSYAERAARILNMWVPEFPQSDWLDMCRSAYTRFDAPEIAKVRAVSEHVCALELWHGPTLAFKDMALQLLPALLRASGRLTGDTRNTLILVATSGDTGKAALEGFMDAPGVDICVFYPKNGVSRAQELQMVTQTGANTHVVAVRGNFDDAQTGVKRIFTDPAIERMLDGRGIRLSSANSINLGRLLPQVCYYASAYIDMVAAGQAQYGDVIDVCVPTGNFGNILACLYARKMGVPIGIIVCASNENHVLTDFIQSGVYDRRRAFHLTSSPSMDILISSNLERALYLFAENDDQQVRAWMKMLGEDGIYRVSDDALLRLQACLVGGWADEAQVAAEIRRSFVEDKYLLDPHTAVASAVARAYMRDADVKRPMLVVSTASPYKFGKSVLQALTGDADADDFVCCARLAAYTGTTVPESIRALPNLPVLHDRECDKEAMWQAILPILGEARV